MTISARLGQLRIRPRAVREVKAEAAAAAAADVLTSEVCGRLVGYFSTRLQGILTSPNRFLALAMGRRTGKTTLALVRWLIFAPAHSTSLYLAPTARKAAEIVAPKVVELVQAFPELLDKLVFRDGAVEYVPTGKRLTCMGLSTKADVERLRGDRHPIVIFDEIGALDLERFELAVDAVAPAMFDYAASLGCGFIFMGTASRAWGSYVHWLFEDCTATARHGVDRTQPERWHATLRDNPRFSTNAEEVIDAELKRKGLTRDSAWYLREIEAKFVLNAEDSVCRSSGEAVLTSETAAAEYVGVSPAYRGWSAVVGIATRGQQLIVVATEQRRQQSPTDLVGWLRAAHPSAAWATDGSEPALPGVFERSYGLLLENARAAHGPNFLSLVAHLDGLIRTKALVFHISALPLLEELQALTLAESGDRPHPGQDSRQVKALLAALSLTAEGQSMVAQPPEDRSMEARFLRHRALRTGR